MDYILSNRWLRWLIGAHLWCMLGNSSTKQTTITSEYTNSFNQTESRVDSQSDSGNTSISLGGTGASFDPYTLFSLVAGLIALLGGVFLLTRKGHS